MHRVDLSKAILILLTLTALSAVAVMADEILLPEEEAPRALFQTQLGDADVDLFLEGTWTIQSSLGAVWGTPGPVSPAVPGFSSGFLFDQIPDLTLSLWLMDRYFFETTLSEDSAFNTYLLGYEGKEGELLRRVRLGNTDTAIDSTPLMEVPEHPAGALGASATLETESSRHELLLRYQKTSRVTKTFAGTTETEDINLDPGEYLRGRYFLLPDENVKNVIVYLEDTDGDFTGTDGRLYRQATGYEASVSAEDGFLVLSAYPAGRVLIYYEENTFSVGDGSIGQNALAGLNGNQPDPSAAAVDFQFDATVYAGITFNSLAITVDGNNSLLLWDDGAFSPFEFQAVYTAAGASSGTTEEIELRAVGETTATSVLDGEFGSGILTLRPSGFNRASTRYPLADIVPEAYGPQRESLLPWYLRYVQKSGTSVISVPSSAVDGTVQVTVNGRTEKRFTRLSNGTLEFFFTIFPSDQVEVSYELPDDSATGADLLFISSNTFNPFRTIPELSLRADLGLRWNVDLDQGYCDEYNTSPGSLLASAGAAYEGENAGFTINGGVSVGTHDTRGYLRLGGMDSGATGFAISSHSLFPAAPSSSFTIGNLGELSFTDYYKYLDTGGSSLQEYTWAVPSDQIYPYADGSPAGPSVALAENDDIDGKVAVLDYSLSAGEWVGAQINAGDTLDLSGTTAVSFSYRLTKSGAGTLGLTLRAGSVSEDLDSDGVLDSESGMYDTGFAYNPAAETLYVGGGGTGPRGEFGNGSKETEDADGNDLLNRETESATIALSPPAGTTADGVWRTVYIPLSVSERSKLSSTRAVQFLLDSDGDASGRLLIGEVKFHGTSFVPGNAETSVSELSEYELESGEQPSLKLNSAYDLVDTRFNDGNNNQQVLRVEWTGGQAEVVGPLTEVPLSAYGTLRFYYRLNPLSADTDLQLDLEGDDGTYSVLISGISASANWNKVEVDLADGSVSVNAAVLSASTSGDRDIVARRAVFSTTTPDGILFLDELHLADPVPTTDLGLLTSARYKKEGSILTAGGVPVFGNFSWSGSSRIASSGFGSGFSAADGRVYRVYQEAGFSSLYSRAELTMTVREGENSTEISGSHSLTIPEHGPLQFEDSYSHEPSGNAFSFSKSDTLRFSLPALSAGTTASAAYDSDSLSQSWQVSASSEGRRASFAPVISLTNTLTATNMDAGWYTEGWLKGTEYLLYREDSEPASRSVSLSLPMEFSPLPDINLSFDPAAASSRYGTENRMQKDTLVTGLMLEGAVFQKSPFQLKYNLKYSRDFSGERQTDSFGLDENAFYGDISAWGSTAQAQPYMLSAVPVLEIFSHSEKDIFSRGTEGFDEAGYTPRLGISVKRPFSSRLTDLLIPSHVAFNTSRLYQREYDSVTTIFTTDTTATMTAVNLSGTMGAYPLFRWYESDQTVTSVNLSTQYDDELQVDWNILNTITLYGHEESIYSLENSISYNTDYAAASWSSSLSARWFQKVKKPGKAAPACTGKPYSRG